MNLLTKSIFKVVGIEPTEKQIQVITDMIDGGKTDPLEKASMICAYLDIDINLDVSRENVYNVLIGNVGSIPVKHNGVIIGYTDKDADVISFLQDDNTKELLNSLFKSGKVGISGRAIGTIDEFGAIKREIPTSYHVMRNATSDVLINK